jgi:hypothetical protein
MKNLLRRLIGSLIYYLDKSQYKELGEGKIIEEYPIEYKVKSEHQYNKAINFFKTRPLDVYRLELENKRYLECADTHIVFCKNGIQKYVKDLTTEDYVKTDKGLSKVSNVYNLGFKSFMSDLEIEENDHSYYTNGILSHNTTTTVAYLLWYLCFHVDRNILIVANKGETAGEITKKLKDAYKTLPFWLKPGIIVWNQKKILLDNGCSLTCKTTNKTSATGDTIHVLYFDEVAKIPKNISDDFWKSIYPTLSSSNLAQIILTSTPDGTENLFYRIWDGSQKGTNSFVNFRVDWWQVPGHDDEWAEKQRRDFGDEEFEQEFALSFESSTSKLLSGKDLQFFKRIKKEFVHRNLSLFSNKETSNLYWHPNFNPLYDIERNYFLFSVDTAEGIDEGTTGKKDSDYNVINIFKIQLNSFANIRKIIKKKGKLEIKDCFRLVQVGMYIDNDNDEEASAEVLKKLVFDLFGCGEGPIDNCRILLEMNFNGKNFCNKVITHKNYYDGIIIKTHHTKPVPGENPKKKLGYKTTGGKHGKNYYCELGAKMVDNRQIIVSQYHKKDNLCSIAQLNAFAKRKGVYGGIALHDDIAVTILFLCRAFEEDEFIEWLDQYLSELEDSALKSKIMYCLRRYDEGEPDMSDSEFTNSYLGSTSYNHNNPMRNPYSSNLKNPYSSQSTPGLPGSFTYGSLMKRWQ